MTPQEECERFKAALRPLFRAFIAFCEEHHLTWYCAYGTAIGVARHQGFIPWDDDIDVFMPRDDYNRFVALKSVLKGSGYEILDWNDKGYYLNFAKFCDSNTTLLEREYVCPLGVYIDVFALDYYDEKYSSFLQKHNTLYRYLWLVYGHGIRTHSWNEFSRHLTHGNYSKALLAICDTFFFKPCSYFSKIFLKWYDKKLSNAPKTNRYWRYDVVEVWSKKIYDVEWFAEGVKMPFEDFEVYMPKDYDAFLSMQYGDYMTPPPIEKQVSNHNHLLVDFDRRLSKEEISERFKQDNHVC